MTPYRNCFLISKGARNEHKNCAIHIIRILCGIFLILQICKFIALNQAINSAFCYIVG